MKNKIIITDLDGTLALIDERRELSKTKDNKIDWDKFFDPKNIKRDRPNVPVINLLLSMQEEYKIIITSGRSDRTKGATLEWLVYNNVPFDKLYMRKEKDFKPDFLLKERMLLNEVIPNDCDNDIRNIEFVLDDRDCVVAKWRELGLTCFQVAQGDF